MRATRPWSCAGFAVTPDYAQSYVYVAALGIVGFGFVLATIGISRLLQRRHTYSEKLTPYECGIEPLVGDSWSPFAVRYYICALLFVIFDVEAVFVYPWALIFRSLGKAGFAEMMIFIAVLLFGLIYAWAKGALEWS